MAPEAGGVTVYDLRQAAKATLRCQPKLLETRGRDEVALVYLLQLGADPERTLVETVDSLDPRFARDDKSVIILSTQFGCPVRCKLCDAGGAFYGNLDVDQLLAQVRFVAERRPEVRQTRKLKVHFARMGEPALNDAVLDALDALPELLQNPGLIPALATVAPAHREPFFERLLAIKRKHYEGHFQLQLSINSTDPATRAELMPIPLLDLPTLARIGAAFHGPSDRKVVLNFALAQTIPLDPAVLAATFDPAHFMVKLTPVNPTERAQAAGLASVLTPEQPGAAYDLVARLEAAGFDVVVSIGDPAEIAIGSNCGQLVAARTDSLPTHPNSIRPPADPNSSS
jgi:23S rRNA (adenine2503-C2)-methyltransferase